MNKIRAQISRIIFLLFLINLSVICHGGQDDFTSVWYYGCRWLGGLSVKLVCNCTSEAKEVNFNRDINSPNLESIEINGCPIVRFERNSVEHFRNLRQIKITGDHSTIIIFESNSISWNGYSSDHNERFDFGKPGLKITLENANVKIIASQAFSGAINEIHFINVVIDTIDAFAFTNIWSMETFEIRNSIVKDLKPQSFKKFSMENFQFNNVTIEELPSRAISDITTYRKFSLTNCRFGILRSSAFIVQSLTNVIVANNEIKQLDGEALFMTVAGDVTIKNNIFYTVNNHAFYAIKLIQDDSVSVHLVSVGIDSNVISTMEKYSFQMQDNLDTKILNLNLNQTCSCDEIVNNYKNQPFYNEIQCLNNHNDYISARQFKTDSCSVLTGHSTTIIIVCVLIALIGILAIAAYLYFKLVYRSQKYGCNKDRKTPISLIVPDGRTYRETELHVIVEKADLLTTDL